MKQNRDTIKFELPPETVALLATSNSVILKIGDKYYEVKEVKHDKTK